MTDWSSLIRIVQAVQQHEIYNLAAQSHVAVFFEEHAYTAVRLTNMRRYDWYATEQALFDDCSQACVLHMDKEHGIPISLNVECAKATIKSLMFEI